jgi:hypothetical protein
MSPCLNSTKFSPFYLMTGKNMELDIDRALQTETQLTGNAKGFNYNMEIKPM